MCLLVVLTGLHPDFPLVVAANRDERLDRPATALTVLHERQPRILGGQDHLAGGTWLAVNEHGVVAGLTNRPRPGGRDPDKRSRGELPLALAGRRSAAEGVEVLRHGLRPAEFNPCWLLVGDRHDLFLVDMTEPSRAEVSVLPAGLHVLENHPPGQPSPKVDRVRTLVGDLTDLAPDDLRSRLANVLADHVVPEGASGDRPEVAACCVHSDGYGTTSSALVLVTDDSSVRPAMSVADGPPCTAAYQDAGGLW